jgi:hypothetical protein
LFSAAHVAAQIAVFPACKSVREKKREKMTIYITKTLKPLTGLNKALMSKSVSIHAHIVALCNNEAINKPLASRFKTHTNLMHLSAWQQAPAAHSHKFQPICTAVREWAMPIHFQACSARSHQT